MGAARAVHTVHTLCFVFWLFCVFLPSERESDRFISNNKEICCISSRVVSLLFSKC